MWNPTGKLKSQTLIFSSLYIACLQDSVKSLQGRVYKNNNNKSLHVRGNSRDVSGMEEIRKNNVFSMHDYNITVVYAKFVRSNERLH